MPFGKIENYAEYYVDLNRNRVTLKATCNTSGFVLDEK